MIPLSSHIVHDGYLYQVLERNENAAIYEQYQDGILIGYEVYRIIIDKEKTIQSKGVTYHYPEREHLPTKQQFGYLAWAYYCFSQPEKALKLAYERYNSIRDNTQ